MNRFYEPHDFNAYSFTGASGRDWFSRGRGYSRGHGMFLKCVILVKCYRQVIVSFVSNRAFAGH